MESPRRDIIRDARAATMPFGTALEIGGVVFVLRLIDLVRRHHSASLMFATLIDADRSLCVIRKDYAGG
jgi:hypothetical protein